MKEGTARLWTLEPLDSWFFRDGSPYNAGEGGRSGVGGLFPPFMSTVQGAVRVALAEGQGWLTDRDDLWPAELGTPDDPGRVTLGGPYVMKDGRILCPAPLFLMGKHPPEEEGKMLFTRLKPGSEVESDIGPRRFPAPSSSLDGAKAAEGLWLDGVAMERVLAGDVPAPSEVFRSADLWIREARVGIARSPSSRTAEPGRIYSCQHVRLKAGVELGVQVAGVPEAWHHKAARLVGLGGEGRVAVVKVSDADLRLPDPGRLTAEGGKVRFTVTLLTPGRYEDVRGALLEGPPGVPGRCVAACLGRVVQAGGWDSRANEPLPLRPLVPAGGTWFFEAEEDNMARITALHGHNFGDPYGFGQILIGSWRE